MGGLEEVGTGGGFDEGSGRRTLFREGDTLLTSSIPTARCTATALSVGAERSLACESAEGVEVVTGTSELGELGDCSTGSSEGKGEVRGEGKEGRREEGVEAGVEKGIDSAVEVEGEMVTGGIEGTAKPSPPGTIVPDGGTVAATPARAGGMTTTGAGTGAGAMTGTGVRRGVVEGMAERMVDREGKAEDREGNAEGMEGKVVEGEGTAEGTTEGIVEGIVEGIIEGREESPGKAEAMGTVEGIDPIKGGEVIEGASGAIEGGIKVAESTDRTGQGSVLVDANA